VKLLDLFCGAGGAAMGYHRAGFEVVGVDIKPQPHFPFRFIQADALRPPVRLEDFDVIHASPPCQFYSTTKSLHRAEYPDLVGRVRDLLRATGRPYVIENVPGAPLLQQASFAVTDASRAALCGSSFGLPIWRHRWFESNIPLIGVACRHDLAPLPIDVTGTGGPGGRHRKPASLDEARRALGIDWMTRPELSEAIPPAYTEWIGTQIREQMTVKTSSEAKP
jgi:DNA (cytosine-5)-methyltransferase 1